MDAADQFIYEGQMQVCEHVLGEVEKQSTSNVVAYSSRFLYRRIVNGVRTLHLLSRHAQHNCSVDGDSILRTIHEATLQLLWLLHDPARREDRAAMYRAFSHVERFRAISAIYASGTDMAILMAEYEEGHPELDESVRQHLLSFGPQFLSKEGRRQHRKRGDPYLYDRKAKYRPHWYPGHLRDLAEEVGYAGELIILHHATSAGMHASLLMLKGDSSNKAWKVLRGAIFSLRAAGAVAEALGIHLTDDQVEKINRAKANIFDNGLPPQPEVDP